MYGCLFLMLEGGGGNFCQSPIVLQKARIDRG
jgi:hypothetical protein